MISRRMDGLRIRTLIVAGCLGLAFLGLSGRLVYLQVVKHEEYLRLPRTQPPKAMPVLAPSISKE